MNAILRKLATVVIMVATLIVVGSVPASAQTCRAFTHIVQEGESLVEIAKGYDVTARELVELNNLSTNVIAVGQILVVYPCVGTATPATDPQVTAPEVEDADVVVDTEPVTEEPEATSDVARSSQQTTEFEGSFVIEGALAKVDPVNVLIADHAPFVNTIGYGSEMILAEPGVLLTHDATAEEIAHAKGAIDRFSPLTQIPLNDPDGTQSGCGEGRFVMFTGNAGTIQIEDVKLRALGEEATNSFILIRCRFSDNIANSDAGGEIFISDYEPGFAQIMLFPAGAFMSEEAFMQAVGISTETYSCGSESCSNLKVLFYDANTQAFAALAYTVEGGWTQIDSNVDLSEGAAG